MNTAEAVNPRVTVALIWLTLAAGSLYLFLFEPGKSGFFPVCPFRLLTGLACPGCGTTRGLHRLVHGDAIAAFELNPFMVLSLPVLLYALVRYTGAAMGRRPVNANRVPAKYIWVLFVIVLSFWIFRNTRFYPFPS
ncbi:MAG: DUF2752 domain-containing protein [Pyrinomonadaceae bacterium]